MKVLVKRCLSIVKKDPAKSTGILVKKLAGLGEILRGVYVGHSGRDSLVQAIDKNYCGFIYS